MAENTLTKLTRNQFIPFLDVAKDMTLKACSWKAIDLSTIFELSINENSEDVDYICNENTITEIKNNAPELPQEIAVYEGNPIYDFMAKEFYDMPVGDDCKTPFLLCFGGKDKRAWRSIATLTSKVLNTVDGKISFSIKIGEVEKGTYTIEAGAPTFTPVSEG